MTSDQLRVIAHRGDPVHAIENTLPAIERAIADGAEVVEIDIRLSADGQVVLVHDETTERIFGQVAPVAQQSLDELTELRSPDGSRIVTLAEALQAVDGRAELLIDMPEASFARAAVPIVRRLGSAVSWCGDHGALQIVRDELPDAEIYLTMASVVAGYGVGLSCWTVDDIATAQRLVGLGARRIISNRAWQLRPELQEANQ